MSSGEVAELVAIVLIGLVGGALELAAGQPRAGRLIITTGAGRWYLALSATAGAAAFGLAIALDVKFGAHQSVTRILACGLGAGALLRSGPIGHTGARVPAQQLQRIRERFLNVEMPREIAARDAKRARRLVKDLDWTRAAALSTMCVYISADKAPTRTSIDKAAERIALLENTGMGPSDGQAKLNALACELMSTHGHAVLEQAVKSLRANDP
ncbi:MAG: hypothetical protein ACLP1Q_12570 [Solirubrobacteraceae bacterium]